MALPPPRFFMPPAGSDRVNRRIGNRRMKDELGVVLRYLSFEEGLRLMRLGDSR